MAGQRGVHEFGLVLFFFFSLSSLPADSFWHFDTRAKLSSSVTFLLGDVTVDLSSTTSTELWARSCVWYIDNDAEKHIYSNFELLYGTY